MIFAALLALSGVEGLNLSLAQDGNRLTYLDESDPYYVHRKFPKLITPQWIGEEGVEAAIVLAIDDMRGHEKWETYLRPILVRLKKIDGRAPVSIMTCSIDPNHPQLQKWLKEGLSIEVHTVDHACPLLKDGNFLKSKSTVDRCIELMNLIPNNRPVAFRMPCCDSLNTLSPRFFAEIFNKTTPGGKFLTIDTSVFNLTTSEDPDLPRELVVDPDGKERIRKYVPFPSFANTIENYPYPYVIGRLCWEFPCAVPSDWEAQHLNKPFSPITVEDMKASIDAVVVKKGVFNFVFHPHGWIKPEQVVELIDHVVAKHGKKVKFLTFREAQDRLEKSFGPLRRPDGGDNGLRLLDIDGDGFMDKVEIQETIILTTLSSVRMAGSHISKGLLGVPPGSFEGRFGILRKGGSPTLLTKTKAWTFGKDNWATDAALGRLQAPSARLLDLDGDGICEQVSNDGVFQLDGEWKRLAFKLPAPLTDAKGRDNGVRFVDLNGDGRPDIVYSTDNDYGVFVFKDMSAGWEKIPSGPIPMITREGTNNGAWFHSKHLWVQNEDTAKMKDLVDRRSYEDLLQKK